MKSLVTTITLAGIIFILMLVGAVFFQKINVLGSIESVDKTISEKLQNNENKSAPNINTLDNQIDNSTPKGGLMMSISPYDNESKDNDNDTMEAPKEDNKSIL